ncbi:MAG: hypothetical protein CSA32_02490 [Desulfobulbus propionicus]|nr:MAG: hypothetical protein CSA32_02490 [Desulfobulbus propionicus]
MSVSSLRFRQNVHQRSAEAVPSSAVFWQHIYKGIMSYQKLPNLAPPELMRNPGWPQRGAIAANRACPDMGALKAVTDWEQVKPG